MYPATQARIILAGVAVFSVLVFRHHVSLVSTAGAPVACAALVHAPTCHPDRDRLLGDRIRYSCSRKLPPLREQAPTILGGGFCYLRRQGCGARLYRFLCQPVYGHVPSVQGGDVLYLC
jgi:hypothetical protein